MQNEWVNFGDVSIDHGQTWIRYGGEDYAECVTIISGADVGLADNQYMIERGSIYFSPTQWDSALSCCSTGVYGPPEYLDVAYAFNAYTGMDLDTFGGFEIVQVGKCDSFGDPTEYQREDEADTVLHGNASIEKYLTENYLQ